MNSTSTRVTRKQTVDFSQDALFIMHLAFCYVPPPSEEQENEFLAAMASVHYEERKVFRPKHIKLGATEEGDRTCSICLCEAGRVGRLRLLQNMG